jgi:spermidine synthase
LEGTLRTVSVVLLAAAVLVLSLAALSRRARIGGMAVSTAAAAVMLVSPPWDRELLASGVYLYAPFAPRNVPLEPLLKAGTLLYYREGAGATVSVKRLTGTTTLAVDGKTDASNRSDMLTQKIVAHLPLLLHDRPRDVAVIGLGSGVTVGAALQHPVDRVDVVEISPEVVEASQFFVEENRGALADPRTRLIVADGRSHLLLAERKYDVIISEPSNPWIAGVAALFTREFFEAARDRLAPGGLICQWANAYNISDPDLRSIVATFLSVFPHGTAWLVGADDVVLVASDGPLDARLADIERHWNRPGVAADLRTVGAVEPFAVYSLFVGGSAGLQSYAHGREVLTDDRMTLEFSGPRELYGRSAGENGAILSALRDQHDVPPAIRRVLAAAGAAEWRNRAAMMVSRDAHANAYQDYRRSLQFEISAGALEGLTRSAILTGRASEALTWLDSLSVDPVSATPLLIARSKLLAATDASADALRVAARAAEQPAQSVAALEQLASLHADAGDLPQLAATVERMRASAPEAAATHHYAGVTAFLEGDVERAQRHSQRAVEADDRYAAAYDLLGAAHTRLGQIEEARHAFLTSLGFDAHDSSAYANLGLLELSAGRPEAAADYFAEALWLEPELRLAREGLARATATGGY